VLIRHPSWRQMIPPTIITGTHHAGLDPRCFRTSVSTIFTSSGRLLLICSGVSHANINRSFFRISAIVTSLPGGMRSRAWHARAQTHTHTIVSHHAQWPASDLSDSKLDARVELLRSRSEVATAGWTACSQLETENAIHQLSDKSKVGHATMEQCVRDWRPIF
jgi:hypothetical protein